MKNISSITKKYCYGCSACFSVCHVSAITMVENEEGFLQPKVNEEKCINCGRCLKTCPAENRWTGFTELSDFFGYRNNDLDVILSSTSGGMFSVVVKHFQTQMLWERSIRTVKSVTF